MHQLKGPSADESDTASPEPHEQDGRDDPKDQDQDDNHGTKHDQLTHLTMPQAKDQVTPKASKWRRQSNAVITKSPVITRSKSALDVHGEQINDNNVQV